MITMCLWLERKYARYTRKSSDIIQYPLDIFSIKITVNSHVPRVGIDIGNALREVYICLRSYNIPGNSQCVVSHRRYDGIESC